MKKVLLTLSTILLASLIWFAPKVQAATCTPIVSVYPGALDSFGSGDCVPSATFNQLEATIGTSTVNATSVTSEMSNILSQLSGVITQAVTSLNNTTGSVTIVGSGSASVSQIGNTIIVNAASAGSSTPAGFTGNVQYNNGGVLAATTTFNVSSTGVLVQTFETEEHADQFPGVDMGQKIDNAEVALCANFGGGSIIVPAGQFPYTTGIAISGCPTQVIGQGGGGFYAPGATTLLYNGSGTAYQYNAAGYSSAGVGLFNLSLVGPAGIYAGGNTGIGSSTITSSYGILAGGFTGNVSSASTTSNLITYSGSIPVYLGNGMPVSFSGGSLPGGISAGTTYYLGSVSTTTFAVYTSASLATRVTLTSSGSGSFTSNGTGEFGFNINGVNVSGFGTALEIGTSASFLNMTNSVLQKNGRNIDSPQVTGANGENLRVSNSIIADSNSSDGISISDNCIVIQQSGNVQWTFDNTSFDDCQIKSTQFGGTANIWNFNSDHDEDPNTGAGAYDRIVTQASQAGAQAVVINISGGDFMEDKTSGIEPEFISFGGTLNLTNVTGDINNNVTTPLTNFATALNSTAITSWNGLANQGYNTSNGANTGFTNTVGNTPYTVDGLQVGNSAPVWTSVDTGLLGRVNIQNLNSYLYVPTTFATTGCASSSTATDFGACVDAMYQSRLGLASSVMIIAPTLTNISYSVPINFNINGLRADLVGVAGEGTTITYTGTGAAVTLNYGIQSTGVSHTIGQGIGSINLIGSNTATSTPVTTAQIGVLAGGNFGAAGTVINDMDISGFQFGLYLATNTYNFTLQDSLIRNNGTNVYVAAPSNSGESDRFTNDFIVDGANNNPLDCFLDENSGNSGLYIDGTSFDDCQVHLRQAILSATFSGDYWENPGHTKWLAYPYLVVDANSSGVNATTISGGLMMNDASNSAQYPPEFIQNGNSMTITGLGAYNNAAGGGHPNTVPLLVQEVGSHAHTTILGFNNEVNAVQNTINSLGPISNFTDATSSYYGLMQLNGASSTIMLGTGGTNPGCLENWDVINSTTEMYWSSVSGVWTGTSTKPIYCQ